MSEALIADSNFYIILFSFFGLVVALYSYYVKVKYYQNPTKYKALCDINENINCTRVLTSKYGSGFGIVGKLFGENSSINISNSILGSIFYALQIILTFYNEYEFVQLISFSASAVSIIGSLYLAFILYVVLKDFCIVCNASYLINAIIFYYNWQIYIN